MRVKLRGPESAAQFVRYAAVAVFNNVFGYGLFAVLNWAFTGFDSYSYLYASALSSFISITVAFLGYKWFVFRTRGNYLAEWLRCLGVYASSVLIGLCGLAILVPILRRRLSRPALASYIAAAIIMVVTAFIGFLGHKNISFRQKLVNGSLMLAGLRI